ncbi:MAG: aspartate carbamoyltransferase catalytic subunit [Planctomycetota bacterium]|nr:aspartate carbamoyltransferase catalytic subunit [Planctomycetota bacterium]
MTTSQAPHHPASLLGLQGLPRPSLVRYLARAAAFDRDATSVPSVGARRVVANVFLEDSTRTRTSFSIAARRLSSIVVDLASAGSSVSKGETLVDTARNIEAMGADVLVVRARESGAAAAVAAGVRCPVINAGDGKHEHPTQGLLDLYTIAKEFGRLGSFDLSGLRVLIVGDANSSRVARSLIAGATTLGASVCCVAPPALASRSLASLGTEIERSLDDALPGADAVVMLRIQFERHLPDSKPAEGQARATPTIASIREYRAGYALTPERASLMKPGAIVMHPGPMNRNLELDAEVADGPRSRIMAQVHHGVLVRMAAIERCLTSDEAAGPAEWTTQREAKM